MNSIISMQLLQSKKIYALAKIILIFLCSVIFYTCLLIFPLPSAIVLDFRYGLLGILIVITLLLYPAYQIKGWIGILLGLAVTLMLFALPLAGVWNSGVSEQSIFSGLFPWNDANGYYIDARQTLEGKYFSTFSSRRPLFPAFLTFLLGITQENLQSSLAILVLVTAIAVFFLTYEIFKSNGILSGLFTLTIIFLFYRRFAGTTLTTNLGLPLGIIGFTILWYGARQKIIYICLLGTLFMTLALNARAGAFFILPAVLVWGIFCFRSKRRFSLHFLIGGITAILIGFLANQIILKVFGHPDGVAFSNFAHTLYGLVVGGKSWTQIYVDHPGVQEHEMYSLALEAFRQNPFGIVGGALKAWYDYFNPNGMGAFSFIHFNQGQYPVVTARIRQTLYLLSYLSFLFCCYKWRKPENTLMVCLILGILLSVPFVPPSDADLMRAYAATIPISATLPFLIFTPLFRKVKLNYLIQPPKFNLSIKAPIYFGLVLVFFCTIAPITTKIVSNLSEFTKIVCPNNIDPVYMKFRSGSFVRLVPDTAIGHTHLPNIKISDFRNGFDIFSVGFPELTEELKKIEPSKDIMSGFDLKTGKFMFLIAESEMMPTQNSIIGICEKQEKNPVIEKSNFFIAEFVETVKRQ